MPRHDGNTRKPSKAERRRIAIARARRLLRRNS
jgi:hypothetical protein